jgi:hypothetical protein
MSRDDYYAGGRRNVYSQIVSRLVRAGTCHFLGRVLNVKTCDLLLARVAAKLTQKHEKGKPGLSVCTSGVSRTWSCLGRTAMV